MHQRLERFFSEANRRVPFFSNSSSPSSRAVFSRRRFEGRLELCDCHSRDQPNSSRRNVTSLLALSSSSSSSYSSSSSSSSSSSEAEGTKPALSVTDLTYRPASAAKPLLKGVSFELKKGRIGLIYGPSGSGKSTLLNVLAGFAGNEVALDNDVKDVGVVFQFPERYFVGSTIIEELSFGWRHSDKIEVRSEFVTRLQAVLEICGLSHLQLDQKLSELSGGYQRRVAIAVQLLRKPSVLLLDEPTAGMDLPSIAALCKTLKSVKDRSASVLVVSHDTEMLLQIADDVWEMKAGGFLTAINRWWYNDCILMYTTVICNVFFFLQEKSKCAT